jgi:vancomycin permeability regulator SanA
MACLKKFFKAKAFRVSLTIVGILFLVILIFVSAINIRVTVGTNGDIYESAAEVSEAAKDETFDCILVLGCSVRLVTEPDGSEKAIPSNMLEDRLLTVLSAYEQGLSQKIIVSGDHGRDDYDEVNVMKSFLIEKGAPSEDIFMDHAGFSTYESVYRAKEIFGAERILIVTQKYHLHRAIFIAQSMELDAVGLDAELRTYAGQGGRDLREFAARVKDFLTSVFRPLPKYLGERIDLHGNGDVTND